MRGAVVGNPFGGRVHYRRWSGPRPPAGPAGLLNSYPNAALALSLVRLDNTYFGAIVRAVNGLGHVADIGWDTNWQLSMNSPAEYVSGGSGTTTLTAFANAGDVHITRFYDQSGQNRHFSRAVAATQNARIVIAGALVTAADGLPAIDLPGGGNQHFLSESNFLLTNPDNSFCGVFIIECDDTATTTERRFFQNSGLQGTGNWYVEQRFSTQLRCVVSMPTLVAASESGVVAGAVQKVEVYRTASTVNVIRNGTNASAAVAAATQRQDVGTTLLFGGGSFGLDGKFRTGVVWTLDQTANAAGIRAFL